MKSNIISTKYVKKPIEIEAVQYTGCNKKAIFDFTNGVVDVNLDSHHLTIPTPEGDMRLSNDDWLVRGIKGEYYPVRDDIFRETYDVVDKN